MSAQYEFTGTPLGATTTTTTTAPLPPMTTTTFAPPTSADASTTVYTPSSAHTTSATDNDAIDSNLVTPTPAYRSDPYDDAASMNSNPELERVDTNSSIISNGSVSDKRSKEWREAFDLEDDEELVDTHGAALAKEILVHGRIYISTRSVAFKSNILGFKTKVHFPLTSVVGCRPKMTAKIIPNAIELTVQDGTEYMFSTLPNRDATLDIIMAVWRQQAPDAYSSFISRDRSSSLSSQRSPMADSDADSTASAPVGTGASSTAESAHRQRAGSAATAPAGLNGKVPAEGGGASAGEDLGKTAEQVAHHPATKADTPDFPELALDTRFPTTPEKLFNLMYNNETFLKSIWDKEGFTDPATGARGSDIEMKPWNGTKRTYEYLKPLNAPVGPSSAKCVFTDEIIHQDPESWYGVVTITQTPEVPSGKSFKVKTKTVITWAGGPQGGARVKATSEVEWTGRSMLKSVINSQSVAGQKKYNGEMSKAVKAYIKAHPTEFAIPGQVPSSHDNDDDDDEEVTATRSKTVQKKTRVNGAGSEEVHHEVTEDVSTSGGGGSLLDSTLDWVMEDLVRTALLGLVLVFAIWNLSSMMLRGGKGKSNGMPPPPHYPPAQYPNMMASPPYGVAPPYSQPVVPTTNNNHQAPAPGFQSSVEAVSAMERLEKMEREWESVRNALARLNAAAVGGQGGGQQQQQQQQQHVVGGAVHVQPVPVMPPVAPGTAGQAFAQHARKQ